MKHIIKIAAGYTGLILTGLFAGYLIFTGSPPQDLHAGHDHTDTQETVWTCSMHPQIRQNEPGTCPLCGMDLIPAAPAGTQGSETRLVMTASAVKLAQIQTSQVQEAVPEITIPVTGRFEADERRMVPVTAYTSGRITAENTGYQGAAIQAGAVMARMESPDLISAQQEYISVLTLDVNDTLVAGARKNLRLWGMSDAQIDRIAANRAIEREVELIAPVSGYLNRRMIQTGDWAVSGQKLYEIVDLSHIWAVFEVFESDIGWFNEGQPVRFTPSAAGAATLEGRIVFIDRVVHTRRRTVAVRVDVENKDGRYRPGALLRGELRVAPAEAGLRVLAAASGVLWTGPRSVVYVQVPDTEVPTFELRQVTLGARAGDAYIITEGLKPGEVIVTNGAFKVDAEFQLRGYPSMMEPDVAGIPGVPRTHRHPGGAAGIVARIQTDAGPETLRRVDEQFNSILDAYFPVKDALLKSDQEAAFRAADALRNTVTETSRNIENQDWAAYTALLLMELDAWIANPDIGQQRVHLSAVSALIADAALQLGADTPVFIQYCPMAFDNTGARWLSLHDEIENPYLPETMYGCGEVLDEIKTNSF